MGKNGTTGTRRMIVASKVSDRKMADYIRAVVVDGKRRIVAYAENIDPSIYEMDPDQMRAKLDSCKLHKNYNSLKEMVEAEEREHMLRRSGTLQNKAMELLVSTIEAAQVRLHSEDVDSKDIAMAAGVVKSLLPAFQAINSDRVSQMEGKSSEARRLRASKVVS